MEAFSLSSSISNIASKNVVKVASYNLFSSKSKKSMMISCQSGNHAIKSSGISSVLTEKSPLIMESGSLVLSPNGKDLVSMHDEGIGIVKFLRGKTFLITGATGFLGKVLIEKILRTAPDVVKIFVLIKTKNKEAALERLKNEIINAELFKHLKQIHGKSYQAFMLSKLVPVVGNVCETNLGIDKDAAYEMIKEVDVIINSAANTTFDERYDTALDINTGGPTRLMSFAKQCLKLKLFLQVSTAYVNGQRQGRIMEKPFCIGQSIAGENVLYGNHQLSLPKLSVEDEIKIVLESKRGIHEDNSVLQNMKELGLQRMMDPIILQYGKGQLTGFLVDPDGVLDVVPADMVVNATLAAMAKHGSAGKPEYSIYQVASSVVNPLVFRDLAKLLYEHFNSSPFMDSNGTPVRVPKMKLFSSMEDFSSHLWRDAINRTGLGALANLDGKLSQKLETICRKSVEQAKYLANIYESYTFYGGRVEATRDEGTRSEQLMQLQ
ncbi:hypothetical protein DH2020_048727 [Rehmannia glutinosa]|uniref:Fatty acyl-CoA reductase n=1 Tax=Rehmannia glutinosa TaxID=99300 RepID=A0ABR0U5I7_REHGL